MFFLFTKFMFFFTSRFCLFLIHSHNFLSILERNCSRFWVNRMNIRFDFEQFLRGEVTVSARHKNENMLKKVTRPERRTSPSRKRPGLKEHIKGMFENVDTIGGLLSGARRRALNVLASNTWGAFYLLSCLQCPELFRGLLNCMVELKFGYRKCLLVKKCDSLIERLKVKT
ncbi:hypothetical protein SADUNF_Sadunf18G0089100 [Salix dunnii]|uniref:Uncharacterized protein n=1 Tax=Salix dunnii TaxID=1413687 RepID=A0A835J3E8_9ROSI|nr:hypothetical protein SADUNF_Sadunf18G0089100 [Salix dunnii]